MTTLEIILFVLIFIFIFELYSIVMKLSKKIDIDDLSDKVKEKLNEDSELE